MMYRRLRLILILALLAASMPFHVYAEGETAAPAVTEALAEQAVTEETQPQIVTGWNEDHTIYYDKNGDALKGTVKKIDGVLCYFNKKGLLDMSDGWKTAGKNKYYVKKGKIVKSPTKIKVKTKKGTRTRLYMFRRDGRLKKTKGLFRYKGKEYYGKGNGVLRTGWVAFVEKKHGKAAYFSKKTGAMAKKTTIGHLKVPKNGRLGRAYYLGIKQLDKTGWSLRKAYRFSARLRYQGRWYRAKDSETYAIKGFKKGYGNCYVMAATFYIQAKLLGYDVHQVAGRVDLPHSWTVIRQNGREWVYDPNFTNETGRNGWKIYYGKRGTWRYNHYHKMN